MTNSEIELEKQENYDYSKSGYYEDYGSILGYYQVKSCLEYMEGSSLLDLACGDGLLIELFKKHFSRIVGVI